MDDRCETFGEGQGDYTQEEIPLNGGLRCVMYKGYFRKPS